MRASKSVFTDVVDSDVVGAGSTGRAHLLLWAKPAVMKSSGLKMLKSAMTPRHGPGVIADFNSNLVKGFVKDHFGRF